MINFIKRLFKKKQYKFLGRGGISYSNGKEEFYIDTNNFLGKGQDVEIFYKDIRLMNSEKVLSELDKKKIAITVRDLLEKDGIKTDILPI